MPRKKAAASKACQVDDYRQLETVRELKKVPPTYIYQQDWYDMLELPLPEKLDSKANIKIYPLQP